MTKKKQRGEFSLPFILLSRKKVRLTKRAFDDDDDSPNLPFRRARFFSRAFLDAGETILPHHQTGRIFFCGIGKQHQQQQKKITLV